VPNKGAVIEPVGFVSKNRRKVPAGFVKANGTVSNNLLRIKNKPKVLFISHNLRYLESIKASRVLHFIKQKGLK